MGSQSAMQLRQTTTESASPAPALPIAKRKYARRRLADYINVAFHQACDLSDLEAAERLLAIIGTVVSRARTGEGELRQSNMESFVAAHHRLWYLRRQEAAESYAMNTPFGMDVPRKQDAEL